MSCDDISRYSVSSQSGSKGSEAVSYYLDQDSGQYFSLLEGDGPPGPDYDRGRNTGVRRRDKTPTHGKRSSVTRRHGWSRNGSGSVFVMGKKKSCFLPQALSPFLFTMLSELLLICLFITRFMALLLCVIFRRTHVPKAKQNHTPNSQSK